MEERLGGFHGLHRFAPRRGAVLTLSSVPWYARSGSVSAISRLPGRFPEWSGAVSAEVRGRRAGVAQLVEHLICNQRVGGSNPFASSTSRPETRVWNGTKVLTGAGKVISGAGPVLRGDPTEVHAPKAGGFPGRRAGMRPVECWCAEEGRWGSWKWAPEQDFGWDVWAQVAERLMAADCKSAAPWSYGGSNPPLCTRSSGAVTGDQGECRMGRGNAWRRTGRIGERREERLGRTGSDLRSGIRWPWCCTGFWRCWSGSPWMQARCLLMGRPVEVRWVSTFIIARVGVAHGVGHAGGEDSAGGKTAARSEARF